MKIIQQPFRSWTHVITGDGLPTDVALCFFQDQNIAVQTRKKYRRTGIRESGIVSQCQAMTMLHKTLQTKYLGTNRLLHNATFAVQNVAQRIRRIGQIALQLVLCHGYTAKE